MRRSNLLLPVLLILCATPIAHAADDEIGSALPAVPRAGLPGLGAAPRVQVESLRLDSVLFPAETLRPLLAEYEGRSITNEELQALRQRLAAFYAEEGFVTSGVIIPDQQVTDGNIQLQEVAGRLTGIEISGNDRLGDQYLERRIMSGGGSPLNVNELQRTLRSIETDPYVRRVNAELKPGLQPGESQLELSIEEQDTREVIVGADNYRPPSVGAIEATVSFRDGDLSGNRDVLQLNFALADGLGDAGLRYSIPVNRHDTTLGAYFAYNDSQIVEEPFQTIDIKSDTWKAGVRVTHPLIADPERFLEGFLGFEANHSESTLLGIPFSFSPGEVAGEADNAVAYAGVDWVRDKGKQALHLRGTVRVGLDALDATVIDNQPDGRFTSVQGQIQYGLRLPWRRSTALVRATFQYSFDQLQNMEKLPVGGMGSVRGYRQNTLVRDNGAVVSLEYRFNLTDAAAGSLGAVQLVPFLDWGAARNDSDAFFHDTETLTSAGLGVLWAPLRGLGVELYWGYGFDDVPDPVESTLQDDGIHLRVSYGVTF